MYLLTTIYNMTSKSMSIISFMCFIFTTTLTSSTTTSTTIIKQQHYQVIINFFDLSRKKNKYLKCFIFSDLCCDFIILCCQGRNCVLEQIVNIALQRNNWSFLYCFDCFDFELESIQKVVNYQCLLRLCTVTLLLLIIYYRNK